MNRNGCTIEMNDDRDENSHVCLLSRVKVLARLVLSNSSDGIKRQPWQCSDCRLVDSPANQVSWSYMVN